MSVNSKRRVCLLNDGRAGHWRQVRALANFLPLTACEIPLRLKDPWRLIAPRSLPFGLTAHPGLLAELDTAPAVIISCGRQSAVAARWLQQFFDDQPKTVQILNCGLPPERFSWVIAPEHDHLAGSNVIQSIGSLNPVDETWLSRGEDDVAQADLLPQPRATLLLGGPSRHFNFSQRWFSNCIQGLCKQLARVQGSLVLVESPRTPAWVADILATMQHKVPMVRIPWHEQAPRLSAEQYAATLAIADCLLVTADSVNLMSEACASGKPVLLVGSRRATGKMAGFCKRLLKSGYAWELDVTPIGGSGVPETAMLRETEQIADRLLASGLLS